MTSATPHNYLPVEKPQPAFWATAEDEFHNHRTTPELPEHADIVRNKIGDSNVSATTN